MENLKQSSRAYEENHYQLALNHFNKEINKLNKEDKAINNKQRRIAQANVGASLVGTAIPAIQMIGEISNIAVAHPGFWDFTNYFHLVTENVMPTMMITASIPFAVRAASIYLEGNLDGDSVKEELKEKINEKNSFINAYLKDKNRVSQAVSVGTKQRTKETYVLEPFSPVEKKQLEIRKNIKKLNIEKTKIWKENAKFTFSMALFNGVLGGISVISSNTDASLSIMCAITALTVSGISITAGVESFSKNFAMNRERRKLQKLTMQPIKKQSRKEVIDEPIGRNILTKTVRTR